MRDGEKKKAFKKELNGQRRQLSKIKSDTLDEVGNIMGVALIEIRAILKASPTEYQQFLLPQYEKQIDTAMRVMGNNAAKVMEQAVKNTWDIGIQFIDAPLLAASSSVSAMLPAMDMAQLFAMQNFSTGKIKSIGIEMIDKINTQLGLAVMGTQTTSEAVDVIQNLLDVSQRERAMRIVRTEMGRVYSFATQQRQTQASLFLPGLKKEWRKSGKLHQRESHAAANGQIRDINDRFNIGGVLMLHPHDPAAPAKEVINCGCTSLPYMDSWFVKSSAR